MDKFTQNITEPTEVMRVALHLINALGALRCFCGKPAKLFERIWLKVVLVFSLAWAGIAPAWAGNAHAAASQADLTTYHMGQIPSDATKGLGSWIWTDYTSDRQKCRLWKEFDIPYGTKAVSARLRMTADDGYQFFLDGRELGQGADWRCLTEYDLTLLLSPGHHVLAVNCFNDLYLAGLVMDLSIQLNNGKTLNIKSDSSWRVVPENVSDWQELRHARAEWPAATIQDESKRQPYWNAGHWPDDYMRVPQFQPLFIPFWQTGWFHLALGAGCGLILLVCILLSMQLALHAKEQRFLNLERARIARDIHDDFGTQLTRLVLEGEVAQSELPDQAKARLHFSRISDGLRQALETMDEVLWAVNPCRDTVSDFVTYACEYAQTFLQTTSIQCLLEVEPDMPPMLHFDLPLRRSLLLAVKEAISNAAKYSGATKLLLKIHRQENDLVVVVQDDGKGFDSSQIHSERNGLRNMIQRMSEVGGHCAIISRPGQGCRVEFNVPLKRQQSHFRRPIFHWRTWFNRRSKSAAAQTPEAASNKILEA